MMTHPASGQGAIAHVPNLCCPAEQESAKGLETVWLFGGGWAIGVLIRLVTIA